MRGKLGSVDATEPYMLIDEGKTVTIQDGFFEKEVVVVPNTRMKATTDGIFLPKEIIRQFGKGLKPVDVFVLIFLYVNEKPGVGIRMSFRRMASGTGLSINTVRMSIEKMILSGFIDVKREDPGKSANLYKTRIQ